jgi:hypothetical protein
MSGNSSFWDDADLISVYTRAQAIEDGVLVDATISDLAEVSRQHYKYPIAMTSEVFTIMQRSVKNRRYCNDYRGVWHDILWMSKRNVISRPDPTTVLFTVKITGAGRRQLYTFKMVCGPGDDSSPVLTLMLPEQD